MKEERAFQLQHPFYLNVKCKRLLIHLPTRNSNEGKLLLIISMF